METPINMTKGGEQPSNTDMDLPNNRNSDETY